MVGMSFIAGFLLLVLADEGATFHSFVSFVDIILPDALQDLGPQIEINIFDEIVQEKLPKLSAHLEELGIPTQAFSTEWFMTAFATTFPSTTVKCAHTQRCACRMRMGGVYVCV